MRDREGKGLDVVYVWVGESGNQWSRGPAHTYKCIHIHTWRQMQQLFLSSYSASLKC